MAGRLVGKKALITGGTRGIGLEIVRGFLAEGAIVALSGTKITEDLQIDGQSVPSFRAELSDPDAPAHLIADVVKRLGGIDIVVNNAGVLSQANEWDVTPEEWDRLHAVNTRAVFFVSREAAKSMRASGGGSIINVASISGQSGGLAASPDYASSKGAVVALTRALAKRLAAYGIRVNCVSPAQIETDMMHGWDSTLRERLMQITPMKRFGRSDEVTGATIFLASEESSYVTGQVLSINGGSFMG